MNNQKTRTYYALLNISANIIGFIFNTILGFIARFFFVKYLTADYLGLNGLFSNIIAMLSITELGIGGVIAYTLYEPLAKNQHEKTVALLKLFSKTYKIIGIVVAVIGVSLIPFLDIILREPPRVKENITFIYLLFLFSASFSYFFSYKISLLRASQKDYIVVGLNYIITIIQSVLQIIFLIRTKDYLMYLYIQVVGGIVYNLLISYIVKKQYDFSNVSKEYKLSINEKRKIVKNVWALTVSRFSGLLVNSTDNIIISYLINVTAVGLLSNYVLLISTLGSLASNLLLSLKSSIGNFNALEKKQKTESLFMNVQFIMFIVYGLATVGIVVIANDIVELFFGKDYVMNQNVIIVLALNFYMVGLQSVLWTFRNALGLFNFKKYLLLITAFINLVLSFYFGMQYGVLGVLIATTIARILTNWWYDPIVVFKYGFNSSVKKYFITYFTYMFIIIFISIISFLISNQIHLPLFYNIVAKGGILSFIFLLLVYVLFQNSKEFIYLKQKITHIMILIRGFYDRIYLRSS